MSDTPHRLPAQGWDDAVAAVRLVASHRLSLIVGARSGPVRDALLALLGPDVLRITADADPVALAGGVDVMASLATGASVRSATLAERLAGRVLLVAGAERLPETLSAMLAQLLDEGVAMVLLDEGDEAHVPAMVADRVAMRVDLDALSLRDIVAVPDAIDRGAPVGDILPALCEAAAMLGIASLRAPTQALAVARARADGDAPREAEVALAARLVLAPRARHMPPPPDAEPDASEDDAPPPPADTDDTGEGGADREMVLDAVRAAVPADWLALSAARGGMRARDAGSAAAARGSGARGRAGRLRKALPRRGSWFDLTATLIAAAPMQRLRDRLPGTPLAIRRDDIRVREPRPTQRAATIFAVDASGSAALSRLGEVKGAIEHLLAHSYVRRDEVALVAFRGEGAETLLSPTRSLARAKRELAALPGGGATPLAAGIMAGLDQAIRSRADGRTPLLLLITDGGANIARDGTPGRDRARADADAAAALVATARVAALVVDSSPRGEPRVQALAASMDARYVALPRPDDAALARLVEDAR